jgi:hypothetical protein
MRGKNGRQPFSTGFVAQTGAKGPFLHWFMVQTGAKGHYLLVPV